MVKLVPRSSASKVRVQPEEETRSVNSAKGRAADPREGAAPGPASIPGGASSSALPGAPVWKVGRRGGTCAGCARLFADGNLVFSTLFIEDVLGSDVPAVRRVDRCGVCHQERARSAGEIHWRTKFQSEPRKAKLDLVALGEVFRQLQASQDPRFGDVLYLVTLMMLRHRKLRVVKTRSDENKDYLTVAFPRMKNTHDIEVFDLDPARMEALRGQLMALFEGGDLTSLTPVMPVQGSEASGPVAQPGEPAQPIEPPQPGPEPSHAA